VFEGSIDPQGIFKAATSMVENKSAEIYLSFSQFHCLEEYADRTDIFEAKAKILNVLRTKQAKAEDKEREQFRQNVMKENHSNNFPEVSCTIESM
jgi:hypothetical protein